MAVSALAAEVALEADVDVVGTKDTSDCWKVVPSPFVKVKFGFENDAVTSNELVLNAPLIAVFNAYEDVAAVSVPMLLVLVAISTAIDAEVEVKAPLISVFKAYEDVAETNESTREVCVEMLEVLVEILLSSVVKRVDTEDE